MLTRLPKLIDPLLLADRNASVEGKLPLNCFDRMADLLFNDIGCVELKLLFGRHGKLATIEGSLSAVMQLKCQRCLESMEWLVNSEIKLGIVNSLDRASELPEGYEPLLLIEEGSIPLKNIVEDELLLSVPNIPKHKNICQIPDIPRGKAGQAPKITQKSTENPFSILAELKKLETHNGSTKE